MNGFISDDFSRKSLKPDLPKREIRLSKYHMTYGDEAALEWSNCEYDAYWNEAGKMELSQNAEKTLMEATYSLHNMALEAVD